jgi:hypothetical protein
MTVREVIWVGLAAVNVVVLFRLSGTLGRFTAHCIVYGWSTGKRLILSAGAVLCVTMAVTAVFCVAMAVGG